MMQALYWERESLFDERFRLERIMSGLRAQGRRTVKTLLEYQNIIKTIEHIETRMSWLERGYA